MRSLVVASNWNTILTLKPKIGEYSSFSSLSAPRSRCFFPRCFFTRAFSLLSLRKVQRRNKNKATTTSNRGSETTAISLTASREIRFSGRRLGWSRASRNLLLPVIDASPRVYASSGHASRAPASCRSYPPRISSHRLSTRAFAFSAKLRPSLVKGQTASAR